MPLNMALNLILMDGCLGFEILDLRFQIEIGPLTWENGGFAGYNFKFQIRNSLIIPNF
jgi:hypothetical protein